VIQERFGIFILGGQEAGVRVEMDPIELLRRQLTLAPSREILRA